MITLGLGEITLIILFFVGISVFLFFIFSKKNQEIEKLLFRMQLISDQERQDILKIARLEYELSKANEEKKDFLLLQQKFEHDRNHFFKEILLKSEDLERSRKQFESEKDLIKEKESKKTKDFIENLERMWNDHEKHVVSSLKTLSKRSESFFLSFDNNALPPLWDTSLKPDVLIQYLDKYIIFDAKKSKNIKTYIDSQIKTTTEKYASHSEIMKIIFFVIPENEMNDIESTIITSGGFSFLIIPPSSLSITLILLKRMEALQKLSQFNPEERESILQLLLSYESHIGLHNALNILMTEKSFHIFEQKKSLPTDFQKEMENSQSYLNKLSFPIQEAKRMVFQKSLQKEKANIVKTKIAQNKEYVK